MSPTLWRQVHGATTHFPIVLVLASVVFDFLAWRSRDDALQRGFHAAAFGSAAAGLLGGLAAATAGLMLSRGRVLGSGYERMHHLFVWPAIILCGLLVSWRLFNRAAFPKPRFLVYLAGMALVAVLMIGAGYSGGEMLLGGEIGNSLPSNAIASVTVPGQSATTASTGQQLFLKNCAHCHGADAHGAEGPDLHNLDWTDQQIATRIRNGKKGEMPAFATKLSSEDIQNLIAFLATLK